MGANWQALGSRYGIASCVVDSGKRRLALSEATLSGAPVESASDLLAVSRHKGELQDYALPEYMAYAAVCSQPVLP